MVEREERRKTVDWAYNTLFFGSMPQAIRVTNVFRMLSRMLCGNELKLGSSDFGMEVSECISTTENTGLS